MKSVKVILLLVVFLALACGPSVAVKIIGADDPDGGDGNRGNGGSGTIAGGSTWDAPPQKFNPRSISYKQRNATMPPDIASMPPLQLRLGECYGIYDREEAVIAGGSMGAAPVTQSSGRGLGSGASSGMVDMSSPHKVKESNRSEPRAQRPSRTAAPKSSTSSKKSEDKVAFGPDFSAESPQSAMPSATPESPVMESMDMDAAPSEEYYRNDDLQVANDEPPLDEYENWGAAIYLSNDDSMSLSSAQRVMYAIDNFLPLPAEHIRPHELLNYFSFDGAEVTPGHDFSVYPDVVADSAQEGVYTLGMAISARPVTRETRRNVALTWVIDRSGSMSSEGRMEYLKRGLNRSVQQLKRGDMVHMVLFDHNVCTPVENFVVGRDNLADLTRAIDALRPMGSTDIHSGLRQGYAIADRSYQGHHSNRLVLITDALANTGVTDDEMISMISKYYDTRRIRLSGVGVGREFNDALLDKLTEKGKGAYVFLGSEAEVDAVFGERFISMIETVALDVHFRLHLPQSLRMNVFYGEESSAYKEDVQAIHYFANTSQLFLSDVIARGGALRPQDDIMLSIEYQDPESGDALVEEYAYNLGDVMENEPYNTRKGKVIIAWIDMLSVMAARGIPSQYSYESGAWVDDDAYGLCMDGTEQLNRLSEGLSEDPEVRRVLQLWEKYCLRYTRPAQPERPGTLRKRTPQWPSATPEEAR